MPGGKPHSWLECRCSTLTGQSPFHPVIELVEQGLAFRKNDSPAAKLERLERGVELAGLDAGEIVPFLAALVALPESGRHAFSGIGTDLQRRRTLEALVAWILALARRQPVVLVVEDLQWCDPSTLDFLSLLLERSPAARLLIVLTFRPEFEPPWPPSPRLSRIELDRLRAPQACLLVAQVSHQQALPDDLVERIVARADGIPLFVEELTKMVLESQAPGEPAQRAIPDSGVSRSTSALPA